MIFLNTASALLFICAVFSVIFAAEAQTLWSRAYFWLMGALSAALCFGTLWLTWTLMHVGR